MNDCLWCFLCNVCTENDSKCRNCKKYLDVNTPEGREMFDEYQREVDVALTSLSEKWRKKMNEYTIN